jgi:CubicO group peptidase (beta-lactamase class C family)
MKRAYLDTIVQRIAEVPLRNNRNYLYSDLGMILMGFVIKNITGQSLDTYAETHFYAPLSMSRTLFNPLHRFSESEITPSEEDDYFRMQQIRGHVHDMGSAMLGGVAGHAGLFSTSRDLAVLLQMLLNGGEYAGVRYLKPETIAYFTQRQGGSTRRGYGWDMKELDANKRDNMSPLASANTYGHTGFTGDAAYVDPDKHLVYIFLSNRTYPNMENNKLINGNYRTRIQTVIYEAMKGG